MPEGAAGLVRRRPCGLRGSGGGGAVNGGPEVAHAPETGGGGRPPRPVAFSQREGPPGPAAGPPRGTLEARCGCPPAPPRSPRPECPAPVSHDPAPPADPPHADSPHAPPPHAAPEDQPQALRLAADVWRAVAGHWRVMALFFVLANAAVLGGIMVCPRTYISVAGLKMNEGRETAALDPTAQVTNNVIAAQADREQDLNTAVDILGSRAVMEYAVAHLGPEPILKGFVPPEGEVGPDAGGILDPEEEQRVDAGPLALIGLSDPVSRFEKAVQTLGDVVEVNANKKSDVITVSVKAEKPKLAQRICAEVVDGFREIYRKASEVEGSSRFFADKAERAKRDFQAANRKLAGLKNELGISSVESRRQELNDALARLGADRLEQEKQLRRAEATLAEYDRLLAATPEQISAGETENQATGAPDQLRGQIAGLEAQKAEMAKYGSNGPRVRKLDKQIAAMTAALKEVTPASRQTATGPNPVWQSLRTSRASGAAEVQGLRAGVAALDDQLGRVKADVAALNDNESELLALQTERDQLARSLDKYIENREQTRVTDQMAAEEISSVRIYQQPTFNAKPVAPKKRLIAAAGLVFAAFGALGLALALEYKSVFFPPRDPRGEDGGFGERDYAAEAAPADDDPADPYADHARPAAHAGNGHADPHPAEEVADAAPVLAAPDRPR